MDFFNDNTILLSENYLLWGFRLFFAIGFLGVLYYFKGEWIFFR